MTIRAAENILAVGLRRTNQPHQKFSHQMEELTRLVETAGGRVVEIVVQTRPHPDPGTLVGAGKIAELRERVEQTGIKTVVFDDELSPAQQKKIEKLIPAKIIDRTRLILDIFAQRARTKEGQLQVELAQLNYLVPRLTGAWRGFSQQLGGIGTRGPGERKIEVERRYVRERIKHLKKNIESIRAHRGRARGHREAVPLPQIALVGYTNVGKSTLLNSLTGHREIYADDKLFATLDPTTRRVKLPGGQWVLFTDTVGFIEKLPPFLMAAFRATLEEVAHASLLVHVVDINAANRNEQEKSVLETIKKIQAGDRPLLTVYNKADLLSDHQKETLHRYGKLLLSATNKDGVRRFLEAIEEKLDDALIEVSFTLPHRRHSLLGTIYRTGHIVDQHPTEEGTDLRIRIDPANWEKLSKDLKLAS